MTTWNTKYIAPNHEIFNIGRWSADTEEAASNALARSLANVRYTHPTSYETHNLGCNMVAVYVKANISTKEHPEIGTDIVVNDTYILLFEKVA